MGHVKYLIFYLSCGDRCRARARLHAAGLAAAADRRQRRRCRRYRRLPFAAPARARLGAGLPHHSAAHPAAWVLGIWVATQVIMVLISQADQVAWWAHIGGMVAGAMLVVFMRRPGVPLFDRTCARSEPAAPGGSAGSGRDAADGPQAVLPCLCPKCRAAAQLTRNVGALGFHLASAKRQSASPQIRQICPAASERPQCGMTWPGSRKSCPDGAPGGMKALVAVKRVVDFNVQDPRQVRRLRRRTRNVKMSMNPFDEIAVEEAVRMKEKGIVQEVVAVSIGPASRKRPSAPLCRWGPTAAS